MAYIYKITNIVNNKSYIGQTSKTIEARWEQHWKCLNKNECLNRPLYRAFIKYGKDNFKIEEIEECNEDIVNEREIYWISYFNTFKDGYNLTIGGEGNSKINKSQVLTLWKQNKNIDEISQELNCGRNTIASILDAFKIPIEERKQRGYLRQGKSVYKIDKETDEILAYYSTMSEAARAIGMSNIKSANSISEVCKGKRKTCYGFKWKFADDID